MERRVVCEGREVVFTVKRSRRKTVALRVTPSGAVMVLAPYFLWGPFIDRFVRKHTVWILKKLAAFKEASERRPVRGFISGERVSVWGNAKTLAVISEPALSRPYCHSEGERLEVHIGSTASDAQSSVKRALQAWYTRQLTERLPEVLERNAALLGVAPKDAKVANQRSRWGSCSARGVLRFSWRLACLPEAILNYVVIHELAHLKVMNHSRPFWDLVETVCPESKSHRKWLRKNSAAFVWSD